MVAKEIPTCTILGVKISTLPMEDTVEFIDRNIQRLSGDYICVANVHTTVMSYDDQGYREIQNGAVMALADGSPLSVVARKRGQRQAERVAGPDLMGEIFKVSGQQGYRHFFYGSRPDTLKLLECRLTDLYPDISIVGMISPPFRELTEEEDRAIIQQINESDPDFIWVGLGAPKQEIWMAAHKNRVRGLMIGVGAGFDYYAGILKRAPEWMQRGSLEWLYRLWQEPGRLIKRYVYTNLKFIWLIVRGK